MSNFLSNDLVDNSTLESMYLVESIYLDLIIEFENKLKLGEIIENNIIEKISINDLCLIASKNGFLNILKWIREQDIPCPLSKNIYYFAAENAQLEVLEWLRKQDPSGPLGLIGLIDNDVCVIAVQNGHLKILQWLKVNEPTCSWTHDLCLIAAKYEQFEVLEWLENTGLM
jgi:hypothetical protein